MNRRAFLARLGLVTGSLQVIRCSGQAAEAAKPVRARAHRVLSCNIRVALPEDEAAGNGWSTRRDLCIEVIRAQKPDIICLQEVLRTQMEDLEHGLEGFTAFGFAGPEMDARPEGYQLIAKNPIFYLRDRYDLVSAGGFWLSETPHLPGSLSWGSARARHVNWVRLRDKDSGKHLRALSTHLDHVSQGAREEQMKLILAEAAVYAPGFPQVLGGDLNSNPDNPVIALVREAGWLSAHEAASGEKDSGPTTHGFQGDKAPQKTKTGGLRGPIDFILTRGPLKPLNFRIIRDSRGGRYPSDHYFIRSDLALA